MIPSLYAHKHQKYNRQPYTILYHGIIPYINNQTRKSEILTSPTEDDVERLNYS